jgi:hypothetical protein
MAANGKVRPDRLCCEVTSTLRPNSVILANKNDERRDAEENAAH